MKLAYLTIALTLALQLPLQAADITFTVSDAFVEAFCKANGCNDEDQRPTRALKTAFLRDAIVGRMKNQVRTYYLEQGEETGRAAAETTNALTIGGISSS